MLSLIGYFVNDEESHHWNWNYSSFRLKILKCRDDTSFPSYCARMKGYGFDFCALNFFPFFLLDYVCNLHYGALIPGCQFPLHLSAVSLPEELCRKYLLPELESYPYYYVSFHQLLEALKGSFSAQTQYLNVSLAEILFLFFLNLCLLQAISIHVAFSSLCWNYAFLVAFCCLHCHHDHWNHGEQFFAFFQHPKWKNRVACDEHVFLHPDVDAFHHHHHHHHSVHAFCVVHLKL